MNNTIGEIVKGRVIAITPEPEQIVLTVRLSEKENALLPASEVGIENIQSSNNLRATARRLIGRPIVGKVIDTNPLTISNKQAIEELEQSSSLEVGQVFDGIVISVNETEAQIEYNSYLMTVLPQEEMGIMPGTNLKMILKYGQRLRVEVIDVKDGKYIVSHKKFLQDKDEWEERINKYQVKGQYLGMVTNFIKNGVFINLEPGIDVLCSPQPEWFELQRGDEVIIEITDKNSKIKGIVTGKAFL